SVNFTWTVNDTTPPTLTSPGNQSSSEGKKISLQIYAVDADSFTAKGLPPILTNPGPQSGSEGDKINLQIQAGDADSLTAKGLPAGLSINATTGLISGTITPSTESTVNVTVTATDTDNSTSNNSSSVQFTWTLNDTLPPVLTNPGPQSSNEGD